MDCGEIFNFIAITKRRRMQCASIQNKRMCYMHCSAEHGWLNRALFVNPLEYWILFGYQIINLRHKSIFMNKLENLFRSIKQTMEGIHGKWLGILLVFKCTSLNSRTLLAICIPSEVSIIVCILSLFLYVCVVLILAEFAAVYLFQEEILT